MVQFFLAIVKGVGVISSIEGNLKEVLNEKKQKEADDYKIQQTKSKTLQVTYQSTNKCVRFYLQYLFNGAFGKSIP